MDRRIEPITRKIESKIESSINQEVEIITASQYLQMFKKAAESSKTIEHRVYQTLKSYEDNIGSLKK